MTAISALRPRGNDIVSDSADDYPNIGFDKPAQGTAPPETADITDTAEPIRADRLITSNDPLHYAEITLDGKNIGISGVYDGFALRSVKLLECKTESKVENTENGFTAELYVKRAGDDYATLSITLENDAGERHNLSYRLKIGSERVEIPDTSVCEKNSDIEDKPLELPIEGVKEYISADLDPEKISYALDTVKALSDEICEGISDDYDKLRAIARWVSQNIYYDFDARNSSVTSQTLCLYNVLESRRTVCGGYSNLMSALCAAQGIDCLNIRGKAAVGICFEESHSKESLHEWNCAVIDGRKVLIDTVWNSTNTYSDGEYETGTADFQFFDISGEALALDHRAERCERRAYYSALSG